MAEDSTRHPSDWGEVEEVVSHAYFSHDLTPLEKAEPRLNLRTLPLGPIRLARIGWGAERRCTVRTRAPMP